MAARRFLQTVQPVKAHCSPCLAAAPRCALCAKDYLTTDHRCPVEGCKVGKGHPCPHGAAKCANCGGAHGARAYTVLPRGRPACPPGDGGHHPLHTEREGPRPQRVPEYEATVAQGEGEVGEVGAGGGGGRALPAEHGGVGCWGGGDQSLFCFLFSVFLLFLLSGGYGEKEIGEPY